MSGAGRIPKDPKKVRAYLRRLGVPGEILDRIDVEAEWDTTLEPEEAMRVLAEQYPVLQDYLPMYRVSYEDIVSESVDMAIDVLGEDAQALKNYLNNLAELYLKGHRKEDEKEAIEEIYNITGFEFNHIEEFKPYLVEFIWAIFDNLVEGRYFLEDYEGLPSRVSAIKRWLKLKGIYHYLHTQFRERKRTAVTDVRLREYAIVATKYGEVAAFDWYLEQNHPEAKKRIIESGFQSIEQFWKAAVKSKRIQKWAKQRTEEEKPVTVQTTQKTEENEELRIAFKSLGIEMIGVGGNIEIREKGGVERYQILMLKDAATGLPVEILYPIPTHIPYGFFMGEITNDKGGVYGFPVRNAQAPYIPKFWMSEDAWESMLRYISVTIEDIITELRENKRLPPEVARELMPKETIRKIETIVVWLPEKVKRAYELSSEGSFAQSYFLVKEIYGELYKETSATPKSESEYLSDKDVEALWREFSSTLKENGLVPEEHYEEFKTVMKEQTVEDARLVMEDIMRQVIVGKEVSMTQVSPISVSKRVWKKAIVGGLASLKMLTEKMQSVKQKIDKGEILDVKGYNQIIAIIENILEKLKGQIEEFRWNADIRRLER